MVFVISAIIMIIVIFTSVFCIKNSFEISITEKVKQYGMLSSLGATSKQIKKNVLYEAFRLGIIGIPLGIILGTLVIFILLKIVEKISGSDLLGMNFIFSTNLLVIILSILLSAITIYLSARKAAKKTSKISPIEAIRSNEDIKINPKKLKTPKFIKGMFGIGGDIAYKNLKRNKKKFRTAIISIVVLGIAYSLITNAMADSALLNRMGMSLLGFSDMISLLIIVYLGLGIGIGTLGSAISMRKYLQV